MGVGSKRSAGCCLLGLVLATACGAPTDSTAQAALSACGHVSEPASSVGLTATFKRSHGSTGSLTLLNDTDHPIALTGPPYRADAVLPSGDIISSAPVNALGLAGLTVAPGQRLSFDVRLGTFRCDGRTRLPGGSYSFAVVLLPSTGAPVVSNQVDIHI